MRAVVAVADADAAGAQEDVEGVQGGEAGGVGEAGGAEEGGQERLEARAGGGGFARVDVCVGGLGALWGWGWVGSVVCVLGVGRGCCGLGWGVVRVGLLGADL